MARHLCIVARDNSPLYGFLTIAYRERPEGDDTLDVVLDRRRGEAGRESHHPPSYADRRRHARADEALRTRGYAIVAGPGATPRASDEAFIERAVGILADVERRGPLALRFRQQRRAVGRGILGAVVGAVVVLALVWVVVTLPKVGGLARIADDLGSWTETIAGGFEQAWTALGGAPPADPPGRETDEERTRAVERATSVAAAASPPAATEPERAAPALPPASPLPAPVPASRPALEAPREVGPLSASPASVRPSAPPSPAAESARPATRKPSARETTTRGAPSREALTRAAIVREPVPPATPEVADTPAAAASEGLPRVELSRQPAGTGGEFVYTVRLADQGGRPVPGAQVWMRGQMRDGQARETRLVAADPPGTYRSGPLSPDTLPPQLSVRVYFSNMRVEAPVEP
jgi:hypothetical protein